MFKHTINDNLKLFWGTGCDAPLSRRSSFLSVCTRSWIISAVLALIFSFICQSECRAQLSGATEVDIGNPGSAGSFSYSAGTPPQYTVNGAGGFGTVDVCGFANIPASSNVELEAKVVSQSGSDPGSLAGLMIRDSFNYGGNEATIAVDETGIVQFHYRAVNGWDTQITGPTVTGSVFLRLVKSGSTITGYYSTDDETWNSVASETIPLPIQFYVGLMATSNGSSLNAAVFNYVTLMTSVPQPSANLLLWLRSDVGVTSSSGAVSSWADSSGNGFNATQSTGTDKPSLVTGALNSGVLPAISFNGSSQFLSTASGLANLTGGASIFVVLKPASTSTQIPCAFGNASNSDAVFPQIGSSQASLFAYNSTTSSSTTSTSSPISTSQYQLLEETLVPGSGAGTATGTVFVNGAQVAQSTSMQNLNNISRADNLIGAGIGPASYFSGDIAEILLFSAPLSSSQRASVESYILSKYNIGTQPTLDPLTFSPNGGIVAPLQAVSLNQDQGAAVIFTTNGTTPSTITSQVFNTPAIPITGDETIKAKAVMPFFNSTSVQSASFLMDAATSGFPRTNLMLWLRPDFQVTANSTNQISSWGDASGSNNTATQSSSGNKPTIIYNAINGLPAVNFSSSQFLQLPAGMSNFSSGMTAFVVAKPASVSAGARLFDFGNGSASNNVLLDEPTSTGASLIVYNGSSSTTLTASSAMNLGQFQLLEFNHNGAGSATIFTNGLPDATSSSMNNINTVARADNYIGQASAGGNYFQGQIAEILIFNSSLSQSNQSAVEAYLLQRFQPNTQGIPAAPVISITGGALSTPTQVAIYAPSNAEVIVTTDGSTPSTTNGIAYTQPVNITFTQTLKAIAVVNGQSSSVSSAAYTLDSTKWPAPGSTSTPLQIKQQLPTISIP